ncbi:MAG: MBL fold metallo-hydrolase, partial [Candidatus Saccharibacteria bacterium]|nr:MBL fold metallo-hydrolase [Candidatus Saccharibacteria bacterium]
MDVQFFGANCVVFTNKELRIVVDDNLAKLGAKSVTRANDIVLFTGDHEAPTVQTRMLIDMPGEYETGNISVVGIPARSHLSEDKDDQSATIYKITAGDFSYVVLGHIYPELSDDQLEAIGMIDVLLVPVGGHGYTLDAIGALKLTRNIDPKLVIPTHYDDKSLRYEVPQVTLEQAI